VRAAQGEAGTGNVVEAVRHARAVQGAIRQLQTMDDDELYVYAKVIHWGARGRMAGWMEIHAGPAV
jgi:pyridoxal biosynthesis lyase PdxS